MPLFIHIALTLSLVCSRVLQWRLGGQMDMESKLDITWQQLSSWRQDTRLRNFQRWALQLDYSWHCTATVRTSALYSRYLELLNILLDCNMHVKMLMRNKRFFNVTMYVYLFLLALVCVDAFTCIQTGRWLTVSWKPQKGKDVYFLSFLSYEKKHF